MTVAIFNCCSKQCRIISKEFNNIDQPNLIYIFLLTELRKAKKDLESMKSQAENVSAEYDRLMAEKDKLERQLRIAGGGGSDGDKKDD